MPSQSPLQITIYESPEHERSAVRRAIESFDLATDWGMPPIHGRTSDPLRLGESYGNHHAPLGASDELAARLRKDAPATAFLLWQDPYFEEADGHYVAYVPGVGAFESSCNANGCPHVGLSDLITSLATASTLTVAQWLAGPGETVLGTRVREAIATYEQTSMTA
ncbi:hypothetical protein ACFW9F_00565 [Streptomyces sp. NPDC059506]|uniref:hypothetical protein n=1 Tax=Streptomyces sp. NPDC059506 TaxID=3347751 RepID=UPI0036A4CF2D